MNELSYTMTNETISVLHAGKNHLVRKGAPNFITLRDALIAGDWDAAVDRLTPARAVYSWAKGKFRVESDTIFYDEEALPQELNGRIMQMAARGEDPSSICAFWERLRKNPSFRSVKQLWGFLQQVGIPLTKDGTFLAYKAVSPEYLDFHTRTIKNEPGVVVEMERNKISDDPNEACHYGLHVGALEYARDFGDTNRRIVICEVDPADVVCVPYDCSQQKMRVCKYKVVGHHSGEHLPSTSVEDDVWTSDGWDDSGVDVDIDCDDCDGGGCDTCGYDDDLPIVEGELEDLPEAPDKVFLTGTPNTSLKVPYRFKKIHSLDSVGLYDQTIKKLRDYAANGLKIVGASKIPGGKTALIRAIMNVRE